MIRFIDVYKEYDNGTKALKGVSMRIDDGEFVFLVGPSGSGKSTIIKLITGEIATATVMGSGALAMNSSEHPIALMNAVCSPGGTTIEGVCKLREPGFDTAVQQALQAIIDKDFFLETN